MKITAQCKQIKWVVIFNMAAMVAFTVALWVGCEQMHRLKSAMVNYHDLAIAHSSFSYHHAMLAVDQAYQQVYSMFVVLVVLGVICVGVTVLLVYQLKKMWQSNHCAASAASSPQQPVIQHVQDTHAQYIQEQGQLLEAIISIAPTYALLLSQDLKQTYFASPLVQQRLRSLLPNFSLKDFFVDALQAEKFMLALQTQGEVIDFDAELSPKEPFCGRISAHTIWLRQHPVYLIWCYDVGVHQTKERVSKDKALIDDLTGLLNRRGIREELAHVEQMAASQECCVALIDFDDFKQINIHYGHAAGDRALVTFANMLRELVPHYPVARWGGESFLMVLAETSLETSLRILNRIKEVAEYTIYQSTDRQEFNATISVGLTRVGRDETQHLYLDRVEEALYEAKEEGKNRVRWIEERTVETLLAT